MARPIWATLALVLIALPLAGCGAGGGGGTTVAMVAVPDVSGLTGDDAVARLCAADLAIAPMRVIPGSATGLSLAQINRRTRAVSSRPAAGARVAVRTPVEVTLRSPAAEALVMRVPTCAAAAAPAAPAAATATSP